MNTINKLGEIKDTFFKQCDDMFEEKDEQEFYEQGKEALMQSGLPEDEAERQIEDFIN